MEPLISIIVPVYNLERYVKKTIINILGQSHQDIEIIAVDDGSTDGSAELLDALAATDPRIRVFHKENGGVSSARLFGIEQAKGEYIGFVDGDDLIDGDMYERLLKNALEYGADISHCGYDVTKTDGSKSFFYNTNIFEKLTSDDATKKLILGQYEPTLCTKLFKASVVHELLKEEKIDQSIKINEDLLVNFFLFRKANRIVFEDVCPYHYIKRQGSASSAKLNENHIYDPIKVRQFIFDKLKGTTLEATAKTVLLTAYRNSYHRLMLNNDRSFSAVKKELRSKLREEKAFIRTLPTKERILYSMILYFPVLYTPIYKFYVLRRDNR